MHNVKLMLILILMAFVVIGSTITTTLSQGILAPSAQTNEALTLRAQAVDTIVAQSNILDCATYLPTGSVPIPTDQTLFRVAHTFKITPDDGRDYTAVVWSPQGDALVFVVPTEAYRTLPQGETLPSADQTQPVAVSKNELLLYNLYTHTWEQVTADGSNPTWSPDGHNIFFMQGTDLMRFDRTTRSIIATGEHTANTSVGLLRGHPLPNGTLLAPNQPNQPLELRGDAQVAPQRIGIAANDRLISSPQGDHTIVVYGSTLTNGQQIPAVTTLYRADGITTPLMKNCQYSATQLIWSPSSKQIAYPVHSERPEIHTYDIQSGQTQVVVRLANAERLSGLSWSPDEQYLAFTQGDGRGKPRSLWITSTDGTVHQYLTDGMLPSWSPDGTRIVYAQPGTGRLLDWYLLELESVMQ